MHSVALESKVREEAKGPRSRRSERQLDFGEGGVNEDHIQGICDEKEACASSRRIASEHRGREYTSKKQLHVQIIGHADVDASSRDFRHLPLLPWTCSEAPAEAQATARRNYVSEMPLARLLRVSDTVQST